MHDDRRLLGLGAGIGRFEIDDLAQQNLRFVELVTPDDDGLEGQRALAQAGDHRLAAGLDALGDGDFAFARQKLHRAHLAQIHAHRVVGTVGRLFLGNCRDRRAGLLGQFVGVFLGVGLAVLALGLFALFLILDDVDAHFGQHRHRVFDAIRISLLGRQHRIQFVHGDIAALLGGFDHLLDGVVGEVEQRTIAGALAFVFCLFLFRFRHALSSPYCRFLGADPSIRRNVTGPRVAAHFSPTLNANCPLCGARGPNRPVPTGRFGQKSVHYPVQPALIPSFAYKVKRLSPDSR